jgi:spore coat protein U-like protein
MTEHYSADNHPVTAGARFWDNNLRVVEITAVGDYSNAYADSGETQTWHDTTGGSADTLSGSLRRIGRLARYYGGKDAEDYPAGTNYAEVK